MIVKYVGLAHTRTIARRDLGVKPDSEENLVWDPINAMAVEMTKEEFERLNQLTARGDWEVLEEMPELPPVSVNVAPNQAFMPETGLEASGLPPEDETAVD